MRVVHRRINGIGCDIRFVVSSYQAQVGEFDLGDRDILPSVQACSDPVAWDALVNPTPDARAASAADSIDRLQFDVMFTTENNVRALRALINTVMPGSFTAAQVAQVTRTQYRDALIARWKALNP